MPLIRYFLILVFSLGGSFSKAEGFLPEQGVLPNEESAIKVAEVILVNVYGEKVLEERPFKAKLEIDIWSISGTFHCLQASGCKGGVAHIKISKKDGRVKSIIHDK